MHAIKNWGQRLLAHLFFFLEKQAKFQRCKEVTELGLLEVGHHTYGIPIIDVYKGSEAKVIIGKYCSIGEGVIIITGGIHPPSWISTYPFRIKWGLEGAYTDGMPMTYGDVMIGSDVWIGTDAMILSGVHIGHGAIIAARSVVTRDIPPYAVVAGVPAKIITYRFEKDIIDTLLKFCWWDWDDDKVLEAMPLLSSSNIETFISQYGLALQEIE